MNLNSKYPFDESQLRKRFLEQMRISIDGVWEKFENYALNQNQKVTQTQKKSFRFFIPPAFLVKLLIVFVIIMSALVLNHYLSKKLSSAQSETDSSGVSSFKSAVSEK